MPSALELPVRPTTIYWYLGTNNILAQGGQEGADDLGVNIELVARSNEYSPRGIADEATWKNVHVTLRRSNDADLTLRFTPIVDGAAGDDIDVTLPLTAVPIREYLEIGLASYYPSSVDPQIATSLRGSSFALEVRSVGIIPAGRLFIEGVELEWEPATEGKEAENAS